MDVSTTDLENMSESDLRELIRTAQTALDRHLAHRAKTTLKEIRRLAAEVGFEVSFAKAGKPAGGGKGKGAGTRGPARQQYRNPANPSETWAGRGRPPKWVAAALDQGQTLEDLRIPAAGS